MGAITGELCHSDFTRLSNLVSQMVTSASSADALPTKYLLVLVHTTLSNLFFTLRKNTSVSANPLWNASKRNLLKLTMTTLQCYEFSVNLSDDIWSQSVPVRDGCFMIIVTAVIPTH